MAREALVTDLAAVHAEEVEATAGRGQRRKAGGGEFGSERARKAKVAGNHIPARSHPLVQLLKVQVRYAGERTTGMLLDVHTTAHQG
jgi:hypothetical protein